MNLGAALLLILLFADVLGGSAIGAGIWFVFGVFGPGEDRTLPEKTRRRYRIAGFVCFALAVVMAALCVVHARKGSAWMEIFNLCAPPLSMLTIAATYFFRWRGAGKTDQDQRKRLLRRMIGWLTAAVILGTVTGFLYIMLTRAIANM